MWPRLILSAINPLMKITAIVILLLASLTSCSSNSGEGAKQKDACQILTKADAEVILGEKVKDPNSRNFGGGDGVATVSNCMYLTVNHESFKTLSILIRSGAPAEKADGRIDAHIMDLKKQFGQDYVLEPLSDIANGAIWDPKLHQLTFFKGRDMVILSKHPGAKEDLVPIAKKIVEKL